jgi:glutaredoxin
MISKYTLYIGGSCPYCARVTDYLKQNPLEIEIKDVWADDAAHQELVALTGRTQVPCLKIGKEYMHESLDIIEKLKEIHEGDI